MKEGNGPGGSEDKEAVSVQQLVRVSVVSMMREQLSNNGHTHKVTGKALPPFLGSDYQSLYPDQILEL